MSEPEPSAPSVAVADGARRPAASSDRDRSLDRLARWLRGLTGSSDLPTAWFIFLPAVAGAVAGAGLFAIFGPFYSTIPVPVQAATITLVGVVLAALSALSAASLSGSSARRVAEMSRLSAREGQLTELKLTLFGDFLRAADVHANEVAVQVAARTDMVARGDPSRAAPEIGTTESLELAMGALYAFARQETADAAWDLRAVAIELGRLFAYNGETNQYPSREVGALGAGGLAAHSSMQRLYVARRTALINEVRVELGLGPLAEREDTVRTIQ